MHYAKVYARLQVVRLRIQLEYEADFWLGLVGLVVWQLSSFVFVWALFSQGTPIAGWSIWEASLIYALVVIPRGLTDLLCQGVWALPMLVHSGDLDTILVRPIPRLLHVFGTRCSIHGFGHLLLGGFLLVRATHHLHLEWTVWRCALLAGVLLNSLLVTGGALIAASITPFWARAADDGVAGAMTTFSDAAFMPITIYGWGLKTVLTFVLPFAFVGYYPACLLLGKPVEPSWIAWLTPLSGPATAAVALVLWRRGIARYDSTGH